MTAGTSSQEATKTNMAVRIGIGVALSVLSGVMLLLAFPPHGVWPLVWVAFVVYAKNHAPPGEPLSPTAGAYPVYDTPLGRLATMICHDANYTDVARKLTRNGAQLISAGLNEFGGFGEQYWTNVTFRAVENRAAMVVTARQTGSAIIDPYGRQVALNLNLDGEQVILVGDVSPGSGHTPFLYLGDWLGWLSLAGWIFFVVFGVIENRWHKKAQEQEKANAAS